MIPEEESARLDSLLREDPYGLLSVGDKCEGFTTVAKESQGHGRWVEYLRYVTRSDSTGEHFSWDYSSGLTEYQESDYDGNLHRVEPVTKTVVITEWVDAA